MDAVHEALALASSELDFSAIRFGDVDEFSQFEIDMGWDVESVQLSAGANEIGFDSFALPDMLVTHLRARQKMQNFFALPHGTITFVMFRAKLPVVWCGLDFPPTLMGILRAGREHWTVLPAGFDCYQFTLSEDWTRNAELLPPEFLKQTEHVEHAHLPLAEPETGQFVRGLDAFFRLAGGYAGTVAPAADQGDFRDYVMHGLRRVLDAGPAAQEISQPRPTRRPDLVLKARELLLDNEAHDWTVDMFARELGVSCRTLNYAFHDSTGISPYRYFLNERLQGARRQLTAGAGSVTEICFEYGFSNPSRFAHHYARLFGELPSQTRQRAAASCSIAEPWRPKRRYA